MNFQLSFFLIAFLAGGVPEAWAEGSVRVHVAREGEARVFIVTSTRDGKVLRTAVPGGRERVAIPEGARLVIADARKATIEIEGNIEVLVRGGSPNLRLSGDTRVKVADQVAQIEVQVDQGAPIITTSKGALRFSEEGPVREQKPTEEPLEDVTDFQLSPGETELLNFLTIPSEGKEVAPSPPLAPTKKKVLSPEKPQDPFAPAATDKVFPVEPKQKPSVTPSELETFLSEIDKKEKASLSS